jgi:hypothetical protein
VIGKRVWKEEVHATGNCSVAVHDVQRQELLHHKEPEDDAGPAGVQQILSEVPQAHAAQGN